MISEWTIENFKSAAGHTPLPLAPLTIFAGANSSGKSTVIQSILLIAQTLQSPVYTRGIILNGNIVRLGSFNDIVSNTAVNAPMKMGFQLSGSAPLLAPSTGTFRSVRTFMEEPAWLSNSTVRCNFSFAPDVRTAELREVALLQPEIDECRIEFTTSSSENVDAKLRMNRQQRALDDIVRALMLNEKGLQRADLAALEYAVSIEGTPESQRRRFIHRDTKVRVGGVYRRHFLPGRLALVYDVVDDEANQAFEALSEPSSHRQQALAGIVNPLLATPQLAAFVIDAMHSTVAEVAKTPNTFVLNRVERAFSAASEKLEYETLSAFFTSLPLTQRRVFQVLLTQHKDEILALIRSGRPSDYRLAQAALPDAIDIAVDIVQNFFSEFVRYLGPLRDEPKPVYPLAGSTDPTDVGFKGEHTAAVLDIHRNTLIEYIPSPQRYSDLTTSKPVKTTLQAAVLDWVQYMGIGEQIFTEDKGKLGHGMTIKTAPDLPPHDLTHVGVGVSQVLPILVLSLIADRGSTLIFEQPELHLHPRVQTRLADFFMSLVLVKKQCLVETHSEYLVNRLRLLSAAESASVVADNVKIYFVEKLRGRSAYRPVTINEFGVLKDWPRGFFDENEQNAAAVIEASKEKRARKKTTRSE